MKHNPVTNPTDNRELSTLLQYASRLMNRMQHRHNSEHKGHHAQHKVLSILRKNGPMNQAELLEILDVRSSSLSELLAKLGRNGLITRERNEADRRSFIVSATDAADVLLSGRQNIEQETADRLFAALDEEEKEELHRMLLKIVNSIKEKPGPGRGLNQKHRHHDREERRGCGRQSGMKGGRGRRR